MSKNTSETERMAIFMLRQENWTVQKAYFNENYNLDLSMPGKRIAVKILDHRNKVNTGEVEKFVKFLADYEGAVFTGGLLISTSGFSQSAYSLIREEEIENLELAVLCDNSLFRNPEPLESDIVINEPIYIGVFTCKGGVGKTTISAHLAGAFAMNGYDVALVDLDKQENLRNILGDGVHVSKHGEPMGSVVSVFNSTEWDESYHENIKVVVCDCSPEFDKNPAELIRRFDYCIIPTTLNPLGISKNGDVIENTFRLIRSKNAAAHLFVLINGIRNEEQKRNLLLNGILKKQFSTMMSQDKLFHYIEPGELAIRYSTQLFYWGLHLFENRKPELAFHKTGRYSYPRIDFLKLVDYLECETEIAEMKEDQIEINAASASL